MSVEATEIRIPAPDVLEGSKETQLPLIRGYHKHGNVSLHDSPYSFEVNVDRFVQLLRNEFNVPDEIIARIEIHIVGEGKMSEIAPTKKERKELFPFGNPMKTSFAKGLGDTDIYAVKNDEVSDDRLLMIFYPGLLWRNFNRDKRDILGYVRKRIREQKNVLSSAKEGQEPVSVAKRWEELDKKTELFSIGKRMGRYLNSSPVDRVEAFLNRFVAIKEAIDLLKWVVHEGDHIAKDHVEKKESFLNRKGFLPIFVNNLLYFLARYIVSVENFLEGRAMGAEERIAKKSKYFDLIDFRINTPAPQTTETEIFKKAA